MLLDTEIKNVIKAADKEAQYDERAKRLLRHKYILAYILIKTVDEHTMSHVHLTNDILLGSYQWKGKLDLLNIVLIGLSNELPEHDEKYELHRLLGALLSEELSVDEKLNIIVKEYDIPVESDIRKDVSAMCNLSQGIVDNVKAEVILNMHREGYTSEQIAKIVEKSVEEVEAIIAKKEMALA